MEAADSTSTALSGIVLWIGGREEKSEKYLKKVLTNQKRSDIINELLLKRKQRDVP